MKTLDTLNKVVRIPTKSGKPAVMQIFHNTGPGGQVALIPTRTGRVPVTIGADYPGYGAVTLPTSGGKPIGFRPHPSNKGARFPCWTQDESKFAVWVDGGWVEVYSADGSLLHTSKSLGTGYSVICYALSWSHNGEYLAASTVYLGDSSLNVWYVTEDEFTHCTTPEDALPGVSFGWSTDDSVLMCFGQANYSMTCYDRIGNFFTEKPQPVRFLDTSFESGVPWTLTNCHRGAWGSELVRTGTYGIRAYRGVSATIEQTANLDGVYSFSIYAKQTASTAKEVRIDLYIDGNWERNIWGTMVSNTEWTKLYVPVTHPYPGAGSHVVQLRLLYVNSGSTGELYLDDFTADVNTFQTGESFKLSSLGHLLASKEGSSQQVRLFRIAYEDGYPVKTFVQMVNEYVTSILYDYCWMLDGQTVVFSGHGASLTDDFTAYYYNGATFDKIPCARPPDDLPPIVISPYADGTYKLLGLHSSENQVIMAYDGIELSVQEGYAELIGVPSPSGLAVSTTGAGVVVTEQTAPSTVLTEIITPP